ncbi:MAG: HAD family hydrolase [Planctomycetota bacterium]
MEPAIFLDRDNTLIPNDGDLGDPQRVALNDGVAVGLKALRDAGYRLVVVTNQGGVARGKYTEADVDAVHQRIARLVDEAAGRDNIIDRFYYCPYHPEAKVEEYRRDHPWRKPNPGMLFQAAQDMALDLGTCWMVGDQVRDVEAGKTAGCKTVLLNDDDDAVDNARATVAVTTFSEAVDAILKVAPARTTVKKKRRIGASKTGATNGATNDKLDAVTADIVEAISGLRRSVADLTEEVRSDRQRQTEFTPLRMVAMFAQLLVILLALLGLLQLNEPATFARWFAGAGLLQLFTIGMLLLDTRS